MTSLVNFMCVQLLPPSIGLSVAAGTAQARAGRRVNGLPERLWRGRERGTRREPAWLGDHYCLCLADFDAARGAITATAQLGMLSSPPLIDSILWSVVTRSGMDEVMGSPRTLGVEEDPNENAC